MIKGALKLLLATALLLVGCQPVDLTVEPTHTPEEATDTPEPAYAHRCQDFSAYTDDYTFGTMAFIGEFTFTMLGSRDLMVNEVDTNIKGIVFDNDGVRIDLSAPSIEVTLEAGSWTPESLQIEALDGAGNSVAQASVPGTNSTHSIVLSGSGIVQVIVTGGGGEGVIVEICATGEFGPEPACVDFNSYADDHNFGATVTLDDFTFTKLGTRDLMVNQIDSNIKGLVFDNDGVLIDLPAASTEVTIELGAWYPEPLEIEALDNTGAVLNQYSITTYDSLHSIVMTNVDIVQIRITGGGGEGVIAEICFFAY